MSIFEAMVLEQELANCQHDLDTMANKVDQANAALAALTQPCVWTLDSDGCWRSAGCSNYVSMQAFKFCPTCGHLVEVAEPVSGEWDGSEEEASRDWDNPGE